MWNGKRLGVEGAISELGFSKAMNADDFINSTINFKKFEAVFIEKFNDDYRNLTGVDIFDLVKTFKVKSGYDPSLFI